LTFRILIDKSLVSCFKCNEVLVSAFVGQIWRSGAKLLTSMFNANWKLLMEFPKRFFFDF